MTPKIIAAMKSEQAVLENRLGQINEQIERLKEEMTAVRTNRDAIKEFLSHYGSEIPEVKPVKTNGSIKTKGPVAYGPMQETLEFLKAVYPSWASPKQIKENLAQSGMKMSSDLLVRAMKSGRLERKPPGPMDRGYLYRLKVEYKNQDERPEESEKRLPAIAT